MGLQVSATIPVKETFFIYGEYVLFPYEIYSAIILLCYVYYLSTLLSMYFEEQSFKFHFDDAIFISLFS